MLKPVTKTSCT